MMKIKDDTRTFVVIGSVCAICLIIGLILNIKSNYDKLVSVDEYTDFFTNTNYINNYISKIANKDSNAIYNLLDEKYIEKNNITINNVLDAVGNYSILSSFDADDMHYVQINKDYIYYIEGKIYENSYDADKILKDDSFSIIIITDTDKSSYSLYPVDDNSYIKAINSIRKINIKNNKYNSIQKSESISKEHICVTYLSDFIDTIFNDINKSYNMLSDNMKKRYNTSNKYIDYIVDNFDLITNTADKCKMDEIDDKRRYTVIDMNGNTYIFKENSIMNYEVDFYLKEIS